MPTISFYLNRNKADKKGKAPIILQFSHNKKRFKYYTGEKIDPKFWSNSRTRYIVPSYDEDSTLDAYLKKLEKKVDNIVLDARLTGRAISMDYVKNQLVKEDDINPDNSFFSKFDEYIENAEKTKKEGTIKNYKNSLHYFKVFSESNRFDFQYEDINLKFYADFEDYLIGDIKLSNNTIGRVVKDLKTFLNWSTENGFNRNLEYKKFKIRREDIEIIYLTDEELKALYNLNLQNQHQDRARDLFCFGCFTGLRFSDVENLSEKNIDDDFIQIRTLKTKEILTIPLIPQAKEILKKYDLKLPTLSNQKLNKHLKELGELAEISEIINIRKYRGAERINTSAPKYEFITTHTARRTFITLSLEKGVRQEVVMSITGHKNFRTFSAYIKIVDKVKKNEILNAWK